MILFCVIGGCSKRSASPPAPPLPKKPVFSIESLSVSPDKIQVNDTVFVVASVRNSGDASGAYEGVLLINGKQADIKSVVVIAGGSRQIEYKTNMAKAGNYDVAIGDKHVSLLVTEIPVARTLKIDNGKVDGFDPLVGSVANPLHVSATLDGNIVNFSSPPGGFEITRILIYGYLKDSTWDNDHDPAFGGRGLWVYGEDVAIVEQVNPNFTINIYDARRNKLLSRDYPKHIFSYTPGWVNADTGGVKVDGDFTVELQTHNPPRLTTVGGFNWDYLHRIVKHSWYYQVWVGYENAVDVRSAVSQNGIILPDRWLTYNWLIHVQGF